MENHHFYFYLINELNGPFSSSQTLSLPGRVVLGIITPYPSDASNIHRPGSPRPQGTTQELAAQLRHTVVHELHILRNDATVPPAQGLRNGGGAEKWWFKWDLIWDLSNNHEIFMGFKTKNWIRYIFYIISRFHKSLSLTMSNFGGWIVAWWDLMGIEWGKKHDCGIQWDIGSPRYDILVCLKMGYTTCMAVSERKNAD